MTVAQIITSGIYGRSKVWHSFYSLKERGVRGNDAEMMILEKKQVKSVIAREITREALNEMSLYEKLDLVRLRPGMYIGANSVSKLFTFISGFRFALSSESPKLQSEGHLPFMYFNAYVAERYKCSGSMGGRISC